MYWFNALKLDSKGMSQATVDGKPIEPGNTDDYQVICGRPIARRLQEISED